MDIANTTFHIVPIDLTTADNYMKQYRCVQLRNIVGSRSVHFTIKEIVDELKNIDKKYAADPKVKKKKKEDLLAEFEELGWVAVVSPKIIDSSKDYDVKDTITSGIGYQYGENITPQRRISFSELLVGGGFAYIGAKFPENSKYSKATFQGLFYQAFGTPSIIRMEWTDMKGNPLDGKTVQYRSHVKLNIYTKALYGEELEVYLYDRDRADPNDMLIIEGKDYFTREVEYKKKDGNTEKTDMIGSLVNSQTKASEEHCQILSFDVFVDYAWYSASKVGEAIKVFPKVKAANTTDFLEIEKIEYLSVSTRGEVVGYGEASDTNNPVTVNEIETHIAPYHPCGYTTISITEGKREKVVVFDQAQNGGVNNPFELVAGDKQSAVKTIVVELDEKATAKECTRKEMMKSAESHAGYVFSIIKYPEKNIAETTTQGEPSRISIKHKSETKIGGVGSQSSDSYKPENQGLRILENDDDKHIKFEARFPYNRTPVQIGMFQLSYLYRYIWPTSATGYQEYVVEVGSCRYEKHLINFNVYPNLAWALRLEYTGDGEIKSTREMINNQTYQDTRTTSYKRQPAKWIKAGERNLGIKLETKVINDEDKDDENEVVDISAEVIEVIEDKLKPVVKLLQMLKSVVNGDGANQDMTPAEQERMSRSRSNVQNLANSNAAEAEARRIQRQNEEIRKEKEDFDNNKRVLQTAPKDSREYKNAVKRNRSLQRRMDKRHGVARSVVGIELTYPDFGLEFEWKLVPVISETHKDKKNRTGLEITAKLEAKPIIGAKVYLDFLALAQKLHPIALAVVAALDLTLKAIGDGSKIVAEFSIDMQIEGTFEGFYNTLTGESSFNSKDRKENDKHLIELGGKLKFQLLFAIHLQTQKKITNVFTGTTYKGSLEAGVEVKADADFTGKIKFYADDEGFYGEPSGKFDGVTIAVKADLKGSVTEGDKPLYSNNKEFEFTFEAIPASEEKKLEKFYIVKNEK